jgi:hypothetical protein
MTNRPKIETRTPLIDNRFEMVSVQRDQDTANQLNYLRTGIAVLPFTRSEDGKINKIYAMKQPNFIKDNDEVTLITDEYNDELDSSPFESVGRCMIEECGCDLSTFSLNEDSMFYLGDLSSVSPIYSTYKCYAIDLTDAQGSQNLGFSRVLSKNQLIRDNSSIEEVGFYKVVNGDHSDSMLLAACFLLVSYFS